MPELVYILLVEDTWKMFVGPTAALDAIAAQKEVLAAGVTECSLVEGEVL